MNIFSKRAVSVAVMTVAGSAITLAEAATVGADGGITLYIAYSNLDVAGGVSWNDNITQTNPVSGITCIPTNNARAASGAPNSPGSCPSGDTCLGREKLIGDLDLFAEYIYQATEGNHYLRRVYLSDNGRAWNQADIRWNVGGGSSSAPYAWNVPFQGLSLNSSNRRCIHDVAHHEFGHYMYNLPDLYATNSSNPNYYQGTFGSGNFTVTVNTGDPNSVMSGNFPHFYVDTTNAQLTVSYNPGSGLVSNEVLTPALLTDGIASNDGPNRAHHGYSHPFAQDEWSRIHESHIDLAGVHTEGVFDLPDFGAMPAVDYRFLGEEEPYPGTVLLLDRSGSMGVTTNGITAAQYVQEAGMYLYHSALPGDFVGTHLYNGAVEVLFDYDEYDPANQLPFASFRNASGLTNIAAALESGIDALIAEHGEAGVNGAQLVLMSDGKQTTGPNLWTEVTRATDLGISIHTLSFGDADLPTMEAIATTTGGEVITMSETSDGSELKLGMNRELSEIRGLTPLHINKQVLKPNGQDVNGSYFEGTFDVPDFSRALQFYSFLENGNAADFGLELMDSAGNVYQANPQNVAVKGRLNGLTVPKPNAGKWRYRIHGSKRLKGNLPGNDAFELIAYTQSLELQPSVSITKADAKYAGQFLIQGQLFHRYPLMNINAIAHIYRGGNKIASLTLQDDGKPHIDRVANDGTYSALLDPVKLQISEKLPKLRVDVEFTTSSHSVPAEAVHYEAGSDYKEIAEHYLKMAKIPFTAYASDIVSFRDRSKYDPQIIPVEPRTVIKVPPGSRGTIKVMVNNLYLDKGSLRASLGSGVKIVELNVERDTKAVRSLVTVNYVVAKDTKYGARDLSLQTNAGAIVSKTILEVGRDKILQDWGIIQRPPIAQPDKPLLDPFLTFDQGAAKLTHQ